MAYALSVLDLAPVGSGVEPAVALQRTVDLARLAEQLGFVRLWYTEHHGLPSVASSTPAILIAHAAAATARIHLGSGGIMLPNHTPLLVAETFHTLAALHPGRIDLGIGRAPGTDQITSQALRPFDADQFAQQLTELAELSRSGFPPGHPFHRVRVVPTGVALPPIWLLGSSGASARLAGSRGLGYGFASHFSPTPPQPALRAYRQAFTPSAAFPRPHVILGVSVVCAETSAQAEYLASTLDLMWLRLRRNEYTPLASPEEATAYPYTAQERALIAGYRELLILGDPPTVARRLTELAAETAADELMITTNLHGHADRLRSYELIAAATAKLRA